MEIAVKKLIMLVTCNVLLTQAMQKVPVLDCVSMVPVIQKIILGYLDTYSPDSVFQFSYKEHARVHNDGGELHDHSADNKYAICATRKDACRITSLSPDLVVIFNNIYAKKGKPRQPNYRKLLYLLGLVNSFDEIQAIWPSFDAKLFAIEYRDSLVIANKFRSQQYSIAVKSNNLVSAEFSRNSKYLALTSPRAIFIYQTDNGECVYKIEKISPEPNECIECVCFFIDDSKLAALVTNSDASCANEQIKTVIVWNNQAKEIVNNSAAE